MLSFETAEYAERLRNTKARMEQRGIEVLLVTDPYGEERDWQSLEKALRESDRAVERKSALEMARDTLSLMAYDCIVFVNVAVDEFDVIQLQAVHDAVKNLGVGFMMVGGQNSFGPGG